MTRAKNPLVIIGGGLAGLTLALQLAKQNMKITLLAKNKLDESSTRYAQGGIAAVVSDEDSHQSHIKDTLQAGVGLGKKNSVEFVVKNSRAAIQWLVDCGVNFSLDKNKSTAAEFHLSREGGHSHRRVIHAADATGEAVEITLEQLVRRHRNINLLEHHIAIDLIIKRKKCVGVYVFDTRSKKVITLPAKHIVLATGGAAKVYLYTSNPDTSTGDGVAMAWRAGCRVANMEFVQFHPTCLYHPHAKSFLISEAVRGEGGKLIHQDGSRFMHKYDARGELAPRDIVARAIDYEMKVRGVDNVYLDISHKSQKFINQHFPNISKRCRQLGLNIAREPLPVVPAAHYTCGGVLTNLSGQTDINNLYAIGETSYTGLHGANRLASNSLLECLVFAGSCARHIAADNDKFTPAKLKNWDESQVTDANESIVVAHNWDELRRCMWDYVGIVRTDKRLMRAARRIAMLKEEIHDFYRNFRISGDLLELRNLVQVAELIITSASKRRESRGLHFTLDYPKTKSQGRDTILKPD